MHAAEFVALDDTLNALPRIDLYKAVELRYFGGLTVEETAEILSVTRIRVSRDWITPECGSVARSTRGENP